MVEVFGSIKNSTTRDGVQITVFRVPAVSKSLATRRGKMNARLKGLSEFDIEATERVESGSLPGQSIYDVTVISER